MCAKINPHPWVIQRNNPLITVEDPLPLLGSNGMFGLNFCAQLTEAKIDFHPGNAIALPPELHPLGAQRFAFHVRACAGIGCPSRRILDGVELPLPPPDDRKPPGTGANDDRTNRDQPPRDDRPPRRPPIPLPIGELQCFCLDLFAVGHFVVTGAPGNQRLTGKLDGLEIVDIKPDGLENSIECYLTTLIQLVLLPRLSVAIDAMVFDIPVAGITNATVTVSATPTSAAVPFNPPVEKDQLSIFIDVEVV